MKSVKNKIIVSLLLIAFCMNACEKAETYSGKETQTPISARGECDECPDTDECCCYIEIDPNDNNGSASIALCGTVGGSGCIPVSHTCFSTSWNPTGYTITLSSLNPRLNFCMELSTVLYILNTSSTDSASVKITCQRGEANPQIITITLQANERVLYETVTGCLLDLCN